MRTVLRSHLERKNSRVEKTHEKIPTVKILPPLRNKIVSPGMKLFSGGRIGS